MEKLSMCRICLAGDLRMQIVINTHLQEIYQSLSLMPFLTQDNRPMQACYICCAKLQNCYELRKTILRSEQLFSQMLSSYVVSANTFVPPELGGIFHKNRLSITAVVDLSIGHEQQKKEYDVKVMAPVGLKAVKTEETEVYDDAEGRMQSDGIPLHIIKREIDDTTTTEQTRPPACGQSSLVYMEEDISFELEKTEVKSEVCDANSEPSAAKSSEHVTNNPRLDVQTKPQDLTLNNIKKNKEIPVEFVETYRHYIKIPTNKPVIQIEISESVEQLDTNSGEKSDGSNGIKKRSKMKKCSVQSVNGEKQYRCKACKKWYTSRSVLTRHMRTHSDDKPYQCNICVKSFRLRTHLDSHIRIHTGEKPFQCTVCKKSFIQQAHLDIHIRTHTGEKPYKCSLCDKCFTVKSHLNTHIRRSHTHERPYQCKVCKKCFKDTSGLNAHLIIHTGEKPHQCNICEKGFNSHGNLSKHIKTHTMEKPYQCDECKKCFAQKIQLTNHIRIHTGEKPYGCGVCKKCFITNSHLKSHMRTHTGEKPYLCNICEKCFSKRADLNKHIRRHADEKFN